jgi:AbrB family looped-hinge helix DNA binding protein
MRFFKYGEVLAVTLPESLRKKLGVKEGDEFNFIEVNGDVITLVRKSKGKTALIKKAAIKPMPWASKKAIEFSKRGYSVLNNAVEAKQLSSELEQFVKNGNQVIGVRGFDKRYYLVSESFLAKCRNSLLTALKEPATARAAAAHAKVPMEACLAALAVLKEQGCIIEKQNGLFKAI